VYVKRKYVIGICEPKEFTDALKGSESVEEVRAGCFEKKSV